MNKPFRIILQNERENLKVVSPASSLIRSLMYSPDKFNPYPETDGINLQARVAGAMRGDPDYLWGDVDLFFNHAGLCIISYEGTGTEPLGRHVAVNLESESAEIVKIETSNRPFFFYERNWIPIEKSLKIVEEFCESGTITISEARWEPCSKIRPNTPQ